MINERHKQLFQDENGIVNDGYPAIQADVFRTTERGVRYLTSPGVVMIARTRTNLALIEQFLEDMDPAFE